MPSYEMKEIDGAIRLVAFPGLATLSYTGDLPTILRALADQVETGGASVESLRWALTQDQLELSVTLEMNGDSHHG